jgi:hypothetical protein
MSTCPSDDSTTTLRLMLSLVFLQARVRAHHDESSAAVKYEASQSSLLHPCEVTNLSMTYDMLNVPAHLCDIPEYT